MIVLVVLFTVSILLNILTMASLHKLANAKPPVKEIMTRQKAVCDCEHPYSMHTDTGGCQQKLIKIQGQLMKTSFVCPCQKYTGPVPMTEYFDDQLKELT